MTQGGARGGERGEGGGEVEILLLDSAVPKVLDLMGGMAGEEGSHFRPLVAQLGLKSEQLLLLLLSQLDPTTALPVMSQHTCKARK